ncbi:hypothetical protein JXA59_00055 [Patescibacteria group bacterium]|nr:hypothetical protein [Patescibacteria group bacterium]
MEEQEPTKAMDQEEIIIEKEWERVERLLAMKHHLAYGMALIEADKLFREVLGIVSFGETMHEAIQNVAGQLSNLKGVLESHKVYEDIVEVPGFTIDRKTAEHATAVYLQAILDLMGRDFEDRSWWQRFINEWVYFGESHPQLLRGLLVGILIFLVGVWFLADTTPGQWLVNLAVGFTHFVLSWVWWLILLLAVVLGIVALSWFFFERRRR